MLKRIFELIDRRIIQISAGALVLFGLILLLDGFFNSKFWLWEYFVFIPEYLFTLFGVVIFLFAMRTKKSAAVLASLAFLLISIVNLPLVQQEKFGGGETLTVLSYNKGFWQEMDGQFVDFLKEQDADVIFIEESLQTDRVDYVLSKMEGWNAVRAHDVVIFSRFPIVRSEEPKGRFLKAVLDVDGREIELYSVHIKLVLFNPDAGWIFAERQKEYEELYSMLDANKRCKVIGGDFNTKSNSKAIRKLFEEYHDAAKAQGGYPITWSSIIPLFRVDYIFSSKQLKPVEYDAMVHLPSDHYAIKAKLSGIENC